MLDIGLEVFFLTSLLEGPTAVLQLRLDFTEPLLN